MYESYSNGLLYVIIMIIVIEDPLEVSKYLWLSIHLKSQSAKIKNSFLCLSDGLITLACSVLVGSVCQTWFLGRA